MKVCRKCKRELEESCFGKDSKSEDGLRVWCKSCTNASLAKHRATDRYRETLRTYLKTDKAKLKHRQASATFRRINPSKVRDSRLKHSYGISADQFDKMMLEQGGKCEICGEEAKLCVDHDHSTGKVRKLLCDQCNKGLGNFRDNQGFLLKAIKYLASFGETNA